jgi:integrase
LGRNYDPARIECDRRVADYRALFARASLMTGEAVQDEIAAIKRHAEGRKTIADLPMLQSELERVRREFATNPTLREQVSQQWERGAEILTRQHYLRVAPTVAAIVKGSSIVEGSDAWNAIADKVLIAEAQGGEEGGGYRFEPLPQQAGETVNQAAEIWLAELERTNVRPMTLDGHRLRVRAFIEHAGDIPLASITRAMASDFLAVVASGRTNRTVNNYAQTMQGIFKSARNRGRFAGDNPFEDMRRKVAAEKREEFTAEELAKIFAALPVEISPKKHSPETALPWAVRIAAFTGMRLEEIAQLAVADIETRGTNGGTVVVFNIHNGGNNHLKNNSSARAIPIHSELVRAGLLRYIKALPKGGQLFPGLKRRSSKGNKVGARLGELFRKLLISLEMKRPGLCFHSLRHTVAQRLEAAAVSQTDAARVLGHTIEGESYGIYSSGPGLTRLAAVVEAIAYTG